MPRISVGAALGAGFGLIRRKPLAVLTWGALVVGVQVAIIATLAPFYIHLIGEVLRQVQANPNAPPDMRGSASQSMAMQGLAQLLDIVQLVVTSIVYCAVFRAVLHPEKSAFGYLRIGAPELMLAALTFAAVILFVILMVALMVPIILIAVAIGLSGGGAERAAGAGAGVTAFLLVLIPVILVAAVVVGVRFAFVGPMMVDDGKFHLFESWTLSRGRVGSLCLMVLGVIGIAIAVDLVFLAIVVGLGAAAIFGTIGPQNVASFLQLPASTILARLAPYLGVYALVVMPIAGSVYAIFAAPWAKAYQDLKPNAAEAFA